MYRQLQSFSCGTFRQAHGRRNVCPCTNARMMSSTDFSGASLAVATDLCCNCKALSKTQTVTEALLSKLVITKNVHKYRERMGQLCAHYLSSKISAGTDLYNFTHVLMLTDTDVAFCHRTAIIRFNAHDVCIS